MKYEGTSSSFLGLSLCISGRWHRGVAGSSREWGVGRSVVGTSGYWSFIHLEVEAGRVLVIQSQGRWALSALCLPVATRKALFEFCLVAPLLIPSFFPCLSISSEHTYLDFDTCAFLSYAALVWHRQ